MHERQSCRLGTPSSCEYIDVASKSSLHNGRLACTGSSLCLSLLFQPPLVGLEYLVKAAFLVALSFPAAFMTAYGNQGLGSCQQGIACSTATACLSIKAEHHGTYDGRCNDMLQ